MSWKINKFRSLITIKFILITKSISILETKILGLTLVKEISHYILRQFLNNGVIFSMIPYNLEVNKIIMLRKGFLLIIIF